MHATLRHHSLHSSSIVLATLNARYTHASFGLRYLLANLAEWQAHTQIQEYILQSNLQEVAEKILAAKPAVLGLGVYIWNIEQSTKLVKLLKVLQPSLIIVLGGPEVSYETSEQAIVHAADFVITGWGEVSFKKLCDALLGQDFTPLNKIITGEQAALADLSLPYDLYSDEDIAHRTLYVEASRGCPFKCEFCLSALDKTAWAFELSKILLELDRLYQRGAREFKFVDRTFNLKPAFSLALLNFFLEKLAAAPHDPVFAHFEVIPDHLPDSLKAAIAQFPEGALQFEIGLQTFNPTVQKNISRTTDLIKAENNVAWLVAHSHAHLHIDLIIGLPGEDEQSFAAGLDRLIQWGAHEIQIGILKRLRGTPIIRHTETFGMRYNPEAPYNLLANDLLSFEQMQNLTRFARYWDLVANSGRFKHSLPHLFAETPYARFNAFSQWLYQYSHATHNIAADKLFRFVFQWLQNNPPATGDWHSAWLKDVEKQGIVAPKLGHETLSIKESKQLNHATRQQRHLEKKALMNKAQHD